MGRKRAFTDSTDRNAYIEADEHENHPAELTRSNQFLSLKDACDGPIEAEVPSSAFLKQETKAKSQGFLDIDIPGGNMRLAAAEPEGASHTPQPNNKARKNFSLVGSIDIFDHVSSPKTPKKATWLDLVPDEEGRRRSGSERSVDSEHFTTKLKMSGSRNSIHRTSIGSDKAPFKRVNSDPSIAELEKFTKMQQEAIGTVDWRYSTSVDCHRRREPMSTGTLNSERLFSELPADFDHFGTPSPIQGRVKGRRETSCGESIGTLSPLSGRTQDGPERHPKKSKGDCLIM